MNKNRMCNYRTLYMYTYHTNSHSKYSWYREYSYSTLPSRTKNRAISIYVSKISFIQFLQYWIAFSEWKNEKKTIFSFSFLESLLILFPLLYNISLFFLQFEIHRIKMFGFGVRFFNANWNVFRIRKAFSLISNIHPLPSVLGGIPFHKGIFIFKNRKSFVNRLCRISWHYTQMGIINCWNIKMRK